MLSNLSEIRESKNKIDFLWLELTNACNLKCVHCYAESGPHEGASDNLEIDDYRLIMERAIARGCRQIQFIGGEATLNRDLPSLIEYAAQLGFDFIEVFSNLVSLPKSYVSLFKAHGVHVATSVYSYRPEIHDTVTQRTGSWKRTVDNLKMFLEAGVPCRAGVIEMAENRGDVKATLNFLRDMKVENVNVDKLRPFGRGEGEPTGDEKENLCGTCAGNVICVSADGRVAPCIMSKKWSVGSLLSDGFDDLIDSTQLTDIRASIAEATRARRERILEDGETETMCNPDCTPCTPSSSCPPTCAPTNTCYPATNPYCTPKY